MSKTSFMKVDRMVRVISGGHLVTDRLNEKRSEKVDDAVGELTAELKRLEQAKIQSKLLEQKHQELLDRQHMAAQMKNADRSKALDLIKADARAYAALGPVLVDGRLAQHEIFRLNGLMHAQLQRMTDHNPNHPKAQAKQQLFEDLTGRFKNAIAINDIKQKTAALQELRSTYRVEVADFEVVAQEIIAASADFNEMWQKTFNAAHTADLAIRTLPTTPGKAELQERITKCKEAIRKTSVDRNQSWYEDFEKQLKEANRILPLTKISLRNNMPQADVIKNKMIAAKKLAEKNPEGPEAKLMEAFASKNANLAAEENAKNGVKEFEKLLKAAYEQALISGASIDQLSPGDVVALHNYTTSDYRPMNIALFNDYEKDPDDAYRKKNDATAEALKKLPVYQGGMTMRGENPWPKNGHTSVYVLGNTFAIKAFWSTGVKMCFDFVPIQISVFGKSGKDIAGVSSKPNETEVLFPPGTQFKVTAFREEGEDAEYKMFLTVEEV